MDDDLISNARAGPQGSEFLTIILIAAAPQFS
jgi:hypothetical protein